jgi:hypothetical protein
MEAVTYIITIRTMVTMFGPTHEGPSLPDSGGSRFGSALLLFDVFHFQFRIFRQVLAVPIDGVLVLDKLILHPLLQVMSPEPQFRQTIVTSQMQSVDHRPSSGVVSCRRPELTSS